MQINTQNNWPATMPLRADRRSESGITILEVVVSMMILTVGLLGLAAAIGYAVTVSNKGRNVTNNKLMAISILEEVETLRNTNQLQFGQIANAGQVDDTGATRSFAGFPTTFTPVSSNPGPDGIFGTSDDLLDAGADGIYGTGDDFVNNSLAPTGYSRQIQITNLNTNLKRIQVTLQYPDVNGHFAQMTAVSYLNNDDRTTFR